MHENRRNLHNSTSGLGYFAKLSSDRGTGLFRVGRSSFSLSSLGKWNAIAEIEVSTSRLYRVRGVAQVFLVVGGLTLPRLQAQQFGTGGGL